MRFARLLMLLPVAGTVFAQTGWDSSGNSKLSGTFYFRQVVYSVGDTSGDLGDAAAVYGNIAFDGNGNYTISANGANGGAVIVDASAGAVSPLPATTGKYSISASGYGFIGSPAASGDLIYGLVSANGIFIGSSTDNINGYNDMMIAAKLASPAPTASSFTGTWTLAGFDPDYSYGLSPSGMINVQLGISPDGAGHLNAGIVKGYTGGSTQLITQTLTGIPYIFSNGAAVVTFPSNGTLMYGQKYLYFSPDGNFVFGGAPNNFDMIVGVKTTSSPTLSGLYYQVGLDEVLGDIDTYYGSFDAIAGAAPQTLLGHQRINDFGGTANLTYGSSLYDYTYSNPFSLSGNTYATSANSFVVGAGGGVMISSGLGGSLSLSVSLQAPTLSGPGVYINPQGVVNSASFAPFTARIAPGELITMFGSNLADKTQTIVGGTPATTSLDNVQVNIGGYPAPIFSVASSQVSAIVPYEVTPGSTVSIQLTNSQGTSNTVTELVGNTAPGVFTQCACGIGYGWVDHLGIGNSVAAPGSPVSDKNPAIEGETLAVGLTGLGIVTPTIADGAVAPSSLNNTSNTIGVDISGVAATNGFSGLLPGLAGEYQLNVTLPTTGVTVGPNYLDIIGYSPAGYLDAYMSYLLTPVQATAPATASVSAPRPNVRRSTKTAPAVNIPVTNIFSKLGRGPDNQ